MFFKENKMEKLEVRREVGGWMWYYRVEGIGGLLC